MSYFEKIIQELEQKGYSYVSKILDDKSLESINAYFQEKKSEFQASKVGIQGHQGRIESIRGDFTLWLDPLKPEAPFVDIILFLNSLKENVNAKLFLGLKEYECHLAFYPPGSNYQKHLDCFQTDSSRRLSFVFYLNLEWEETNKGEIVIYDKNDFVIESFYPLPGSFLCFISDEFPHEVRSSSKERRSLTGWMHNKIIY